MALVGMIGEDVDGALDGAGGQAVPEREREQVLAPVLDGVELVADDVARRAHPRDAQRTHAPIADVHLPLGRVAPMRDAEGDLRRQHHHIASTLPKTGTVRSGVRALVVWRTSWSLSRPSGRCGSSVTTTRWPPPPGSGSSTACRAGFVFSTHVTRAVVPGRPGTTVISRRAAVPWRTRPR